MFDRRVTWALGGAQCVLWGAQYYSFSVFLVPLVRELRAAQPQVAGAFSFGLLLAALLAPHVGRRIDGGHGVRLLRLGGWATPAALAALASVTSLPGLYLVFGALGGCMALTLYEPLFALINHRVPGAADRLRTIATISVFGGLASTIFLPLLGAAVDAFGWRSAARGLAAACLVVTLLLERLAWRRLDDPSPHRATAAAAPVALPPGAPRLLAFVGTPFVAATFAGMAVTTLVVPALVARGVPLSTAATILAALGVMQLPGRLWLLRGRAMPAPTRLLAVPMLLQAAGLALLALARTPTALAGIGLFGLGAGLHTVTRPWLVPRVFGVSANGAAGGHIARANGLARAIGPFTVTAAAAATRPAVVFAALALLLAGLTPLAVAARRYLHAD